MAKKIKSWKELEKYVQQQVAKTVKSAEVKEIFDSAMKDAVEREVYDVYDPKVYDRREGEGGLSDKRNMSFTEHTLKGNLMISYFENLAVGSDAQVYGQETDSMNGFFISSLIESGSSTAHSVPSNSSNGWYDPDGKWAMPRPFAKGTAMRLNYSPSFNNRLRITLQNGINKN